MKLKLSYFLPAIAMIFSVSSVVAQTEVSVPAFPGAEGHGRYTTGGRSSDGTTTVYHVTNLEDDSSGSIEGSLRWCLNQAGPRTIVFDVAGYIDLVAQLTITSNTTIAGQTAPSPGITLRYYTVYLAKCSNVIIRFIRFRRSQVKDVDDGADATWGRRQKNIVLDHCSFSWSIDETASFYDNRDFTMQWCTITEGLNNAGHGKGAHGYGGIWGGKCASFHHCFIAHQNNRSPRLNGARFNYTSNYDKTTYMNAVDAERVDVRNCLIYNWGQGNGVYGGTGGYHNLVNNYYKAGPGTKNTTRVFQGSANSSSDASSYGLPVGLPGRYFISGNYVAAASSPENYDWKGFIQDSGTGITIKSDGESSYGGSYYTDSEHLYGLDATVPIKLDTQVETGVVTTHSAETAYEKLLSYVGSSLYRDAVDVRNMEEARTGTATYTGPISGYAGILDVVAIPGYADAYADSVSIYQAAIDALAEGEDATDLEAALESAQTNYEYYSSLPQFPELESTSREEGFDTDEDGMPDEWETQYGLDPNDASDKDLYTLDEQGWYSNLEVYLNSLVEDIMKAGNEDADSTVNEYYPLSEWDGEVPTASDFVDFYTAASQNPEVTEEESEESALPSIYATSDVTAIEYYDLAGHRIADPAEGISVRRLVFKDGHTESDLVIKK